MGRVSALRRVLSAVRVATVTVTWLLMARHAPGAPAPLLDTIVGVVDTRTVAASDIALARVLGVLGFAPAMAPIARADVERFADVLLILDEAGRIGITAKPNQIEQAWAAVTARVGGEETLRRWLDEHAIDRDWARRLVEQDVVRVQFLDARFVAFVFLDEEQIARELGPGQHDESAREEIRVRLTREAAGRAQAEWLTAARRRAAIRILLPAAGAVPPPFSLCRSASSETRCVREDPRPPRPRRPLPFLGLGGTQVGEQEKTALIAGRRGLRAGARRPDGLKGPRDLGPSSTPWLDRSLAARAGP